MPNETNTRPATTYSTPCLHTQVSTFAFSLDQIQLSGNEAAKWSLSLHTRCWTFPTTGEQVKYSKIKGRQPAKNGNWSQWQISGSMYWHADKWLIATCHNLGRSPPLLSRPSDTRLAGMGWYSAGSSCSEDPHWKLWSLSRPITNEEGQRIKKWFRSSCIATCIILFGGQRAGFYRDGATMTEHAISCHGRDSIASGVQEKTLDVCGSCVRLDVPRCSRNT